MSSLDAMIIPYLGLANGEHVFSYQVDEAFFKHFEKSKISSGSFTVDIIVEKRDRMVVLMVTSAGSMQAPCDRCLTEIDIPITYEDRMILKIEEAPKVQEDEVYYLDPNTSHIDLSTYVYESIHLHVPIRYLRDCEGEDYKYCDHDALDALEEDISEESKAEESNPWQALEGLDLDD